MEILLAFVAGLALSAFVALLFVRRAVRGAEAAVRHEEEDNLRAVKEEYERRLSSEKDEAVALLQKRFDETVAKMSAQLKADTGDMLKARQKEFSESSGESLGRIVDPLRENISELRKAMAENSKEQAERNGEMRERIRSLMEHSDAARRSADEIGRAHV